MNFRNISAWSIRNPIIPIVLFIGLLLAGVVAFSRMDVNDNPNIDFPAVTVMIAQPGAAPTEIETQITQKVEAAVRSINGVDEIQSTANEGSSTTFVQFAIGTNTIEAVSDVKNAIDQIRGDLPDGILEPRVAKVDIGGNGPIGYFAVSADDMTMEQLSWFVDDVVAKRLLGIQGMAAVSREGGVNREIRVTLDPARMQSLGVTASQVNAALRQVNVDAAGGKAEIAGSRQSVRVLGNADTAFQLSQTQISLSGGRSARLSEVADVRDSTSERTSIAKILGRQVVTFGIERAKGASDVTVYDEAEKEIAKLEKENPGIHFTLLYTSVKYTKDQYTSSIEAMIEGAVLAIVVVFFFLRDWRATIISAIAIPLSAIPTFWFMELMGFDLNGLSLLALSLVAGVLVDDAIVEIENIVRHMRMGKSAYQAAIDAADEIGLAVVATTMCIVAVFLPVGLMPGISGQFFKNFGLTIVAAVLVSLAVARMITPMIAAYFLHAKGHASHGEGAAMDLYTRILAFTLDTRKAEAARAQLQPAPARWYYGVIEFVLALMVLGAGIAASSAVSGALKPLDWPAYATIPLALIGLFLTLFLVSKLLNLVLGWIGGGYGAWHRWFFARVMVRGKGDHRVWAFGVGIAALGITALLLANMPQQFQPTINDDSSRINIEMVPGTTIQQTEAMADQVEAIIRPQPEVSRVMERVREGNARLYIMLKPNASFWNVIFAKYLHIGKLEGRDKTSIEFERQLAPQLQKIADARVSFASQSGGFGTGRDISVMLSGTDPELLQKTAQVLAEQMQKVPGVVGPRIAADMKRPELVIVPRLDLAAQLGVTTAALSQTIRIATLGEIDQNAAKFSLSDRQVPIRVILPIESRRDLATIENLPVPSTTAGGSVPLRRVADIRFGAGPTTIQRYNQSRRIFVGADLAPGAVKGPVTEKIKELAIMKNLPRGVSNAPVGDEKWQAELALNVVYAVVAGIMLVFAVLVLLYRRFVSPLVNMTSLLLAPLGGLLALLLINQPISMPVYIGLLMLLGIVAKNSILLIDFAIEEMAAGVEKKRAIMEAGHKRAQPIVMTTVAMTAGMIPTALSLTGDGAWRAPMGTVVMGGLILSTMLTLLIVPAGFSLADGFEKRIGPWLRRTFLTYDPKTVDAPVNAASEPARPAPVPARRIDDDAGALPAE